MKGFRRIRHYGLFAEAASADNIARTRELPFTRKLARGNIAASKTMPTGCCGPQNWFWSYAPCTLRLSLGTCSRSFMP